MLVACMHHLCMRSPGPPASEAATTAALARAGSSLRPMAARGPAERPNNAWRAAQVVIQLRKFAEAVKRIKAAVSPDAAPGQRPPPRATGPRAVLSADVSDILRTELSGLDPSVGGAARDVTHVLLWCSQLYLHICIRICMVGIGPSTGVCVLSVRRMHPVYHAVHDAAAFSFQQGFDTHVTAAEKDGSRVTEPMYTFSVLCSSCECS